MPLTCRHLASWNAYGTISITKYGRLVINKRMRTHEASWNAHETIIEGPGLQTRRLHRWLSTVLVNSIWIQSCSSTPRGCKGSSHSKVQHSSSRCKPSCIELQKSRKRKNTTNFKGAWSYPFCNSLKERDTLSVWNSLKERDSFCNSLKQTPQERDHILSAIH